MVANMPYQILIGALMLLVCVIIHAVILTQSFIFLEKVSPFVYKKMRALWLPNMMVLAVFLVFSAHVIEAWLWAWLYISLDTVLPNFETALYFSTSTFTTVGYGDIVLSEKWRLLSSFQSAIGFVLFGWSTAFIFEVMSQTYKDEKIRKLEPKDKS